MFVQNDDVEMRSEDLFISSKEVRVRYHVTANSVTVEVQDQGPGFRLDEVPDPLAPENVDSDHGRGLLLMRTYMTGVCHNEQGNRVCLCKHRLATTV